MLSSILIIIFSLILLAYWFRYTCILLLQKTPGEAVAAVEDRLVHRQLASSDARPGSEELHKALDHDYSVLRYVQAHGDLELGAIERHFLAVDYRLMELVYRLTRASAPRHAHNALAEMRQIVEFYARRMGERAAERA